MSNFIKCFFNFGELIKYMCVVCGSSTYEQIKIKYVRYMCFFNQRINRKYEVLYHYTIP